MKQLLNDAKALRTLRKTPVILKAVLAGITPEQARTLRDGADGWSILFIVCHLRDVELMFSGRVRDMLEKTNPEFKVVTNEDMIQQNDYEGASFERALFDYYDHRTAFITLLESLSDEQWLLPGTHPLQGPATVLDVAVNTGLHDIDHIEQIIRCVNAG
ncbi:MAG: DinB family protein [Anaerolineae bacterium]